MGRGDRPDHEEQVRLAGQNLRAEASGPGLGPDPAGSRHGCRCPGGRKAGRVRGYATGAERHAKMVRLQVLRGQAGQGGAADGDGAGAGGAGREGAVAQARGTSPPPGSPQAQWRAQWESARLFLTADGEKDKAQGNETIRWHPGEGWLEIRLPAPLADLANRPHSRYRLPAPVGFSYRGSEVAAQAATGAVRYDISCDPVRGRWYLDALVEGRARTRAVPG